MDAVVDVVGVVDVPLLDDAEQIRLENCHVFLHLLVNRPVGNGTKFFSSSLTVELIIQASPIFVEKTKN